MSNPRWIVVDDTDPGITYTGPWVADSKGSRNSAGNFGPSYLNTLHGTSSDASLTFTFSGTQVKLLGSNNIKNNSGVIDPSWECFIDGTSIGANPPFQFAENNWIFCGSNTIPDGRHTLTVRATVRQSQTFWVDQIQYVPSPNLSLDGKSIFIDNLDPQVQSSLGAGWGVMGDTANMTTAINSVFSFDFSGISLSWFGFIPAEFPHGASSASYSIDQGTPVNFPLNGLSATGKTTLYNQKFFQTPQLPPGKHHISVVFQGSATPLILDYLIVDNGITPVATTTTSASRSGSSDSPSLPPPSPPLSGNNPITTTLGKGNTEANTMTGSTTSTSTSATSVSLVSTAGSTTLTSNGTVITIVSTSPNEIGSHVQVKTRNNGAIVGGVVGGLAVVIALALLVFLLIRRRNRNLQPNGGNVTPQPFAYDPFPMTSSVWEGQPVSIQPQDSVQQLSPVRNTNAPSIGTSQISNFSTTNISQSAVAHQPVGMVQPAFNAAPVVAPTPPALGEKALREANAIAVALTPVRRFDGGTQPPSRSNFIIHQDSGFSWNQNPELIDDIPPRYTRG